MENLTSIYRGKYIFYRTAQGFCLGSKKEAKEIQSIWNDSTCLVFYPQTFQPGEDFVIEVERFLDRASARLLWIENPQEKMESWQNIAASEHNLTLRAGKYWISFKEFLEEKGNFLSFSGIFGVEEISFQPVDGKITMDLQDSMGKLTFSFETGKENFSSLDVGMKYLMNLPGDTENGKEKNFTGRFQASLLEPVQTVTLKAQIAPAAMTDKESTYFSLPVCEWNSFFTTPQGSPLPVRSLEGAVLVFEKTAEVLTSEGGNYAAAGQGWYLGVEGGFLAGVPGKPEQMQLMPGLAGTEYFMDSTTELIIDFQAQQSAVLNQMDKTVVTAPWIAVRGTYYSAPVSMPFFQVKDGRMVSFVPKIAKFKEKTPAFPLLPWRGILSGTDTPDINEAERLLSGKRYAILTEGLQSAPKSDEKEVVLLTPSGMCLGVQPESGHWNWVGIAQTGEAKGQEKQLPDIRLYQPGFSARQALQQTDCLLIAATKGEFVDLCDNPIELNFLIDGWKILFSQESWNDENSLFILKYTKNVSLRSVLEEKGSSQLRYLIEYAYDEKGNVKTGYEPLTEVLDKKEFQGIFLLGAQGEVDEEKVSPELATVFRSIDGGKLNVLYAAVENGKVSVSGEGISVAKSKVNALLLCEGKPVYTEGDKPFYFCTRDMVVQIENSLVQRFQSHSELTPYHLFGSAVHPVEQSQGNNLVLVGGMEKVNGQEVYQFLLEQPIEYSAGVSVLQKIVVQDVILSVGTDTFSFQLQGVLSFMICEEFDLFSYENLGFEGLILTKKPEEQYEIDMAKLKLAAERAEIRENSFVHAFGIQSAQMIFGDQNTTPDSMGYASFEAIISQGTLGESWMGLVWQLPLNPSGQLGKNEMLSLEIIAAWSGTSCYVGAKTGGIFGGDFFLQGIMTAGITGMSMEKENKGGVYLLLHGLSLKVFKISLPPQGVEVRILGENGKIAWFGAYDAEEEEVGEND
ncbi:MAG: hypothetical protein J1F22_04725 [Lachnospiraceae bacterium]|nr:hypothetical protein [Lachnospiraceae bacterium]